MRGGCTGKVAIDLAISIDLKRFFVVSIGLSLVVKEGLVVPEPGADLQIDAGLEERYYGGFIGYRFTGLMNLFFGDYI